MINALPSSHDQSSDNTLPVMPSLPDTPSSNPTPADKPAEVVPTAAAEVKPVVVAADNQPTNTVSPPTPDNTLNTASPAHPPLHLPGVQPQQATELTVSSGPTAPHGKVSGLADDLSKKIHVGDPVGASTATPPPTAPSVSPDKSMDPPPKKYNKPFNPKSLVIALVIGLIVAGGSAGYYLTQQNQDVRQQAASEEVTNTENKRTATEWGIFNNNWQAVLNNSENDWVDYVQYAQGNGARYQCEAEIMKVGEETLYGCDLNALYVLYEPTSYTSPQAISPQDPMLNKVLDALITNSGLLQEAQKRGLINLDDSLYNSNTKDHVKRIETIKELREQLGTSLEKTVDFEAVVIYFHNQVSPLIPVQEAQAAAKAKMDVLYERLQTGEITMQQAGQEIAADSIKGDTTSVSLTKLDPLFKENAYIMHTGHIFDSAFFKDSSLDEELKSLGEGQMSTVKLCKDYAFTDEELLASIDSGTEFNPPLVDSCYMIFKIKKINFGIGGEKAAKSGEAFINQTYSAQTSKKTENLQQ